MCYDEDMPGIEPPAQPPVPPRDSASDAPTAARSADLAAKRAAAAGWLRERLIWLRPLARQAWINLQVWLPILQNRTERERVVKFHPREHREGTRWSLDLPKQCWQCGATETLWDRELELEVRAFEYPLPGSFLRARRAFPSSVPLLISDACRDSTPGTSTGVSGKARNVGGIWREPWNAS